MSGKILSGTVIFILLLNTGCKVTQGKENKLKGDLIQLLDKHIEDAAIQYKYLARETPADRFPRSLNNNGRLVTSDSKWWCSGFYPGTLLYLYEATKDTVLLNEAGRKLKALEKEQYNKSTHDLGFMMFCSFGNANRLAPGTEYKNILVNSARSLASRFDEKVGCIRSWNSKPSDFLVIIDNMMNLELLFWATRATGDSSFYKIAVTHANTTMKNHFRPDHSSYHQVNYNPQSGVPQKKRTVQGAADESSWARGQGWGLYGYTVMYRETKDPKYLELANNIADFILNHPNLPQDKVAYWDFNAPGIPGALRDASAASLMAAAFIELSGFNKGKIAKTYLVAAEEILRSLCSPVYTAAYKEKGGFLLKHSVGNLPGKSEVDVPLSYADYYFIEAMLRYKNLK
ncbi:MAG: glycosyl hydrolase family 88 [Ferruginibacter sp.]|nr:glycosyl hydrolase family 88 [Ferruginibacter sp.]